MTALATTLFSGRHPGAVPLPDTLAVRGAEHGVRDLGAYQNHRRQGGRWQAMGRPAPRTLVAELACEPRCRPIRQGGSVVRLERTDRGPDCPGPSPRQRKRIAGSMACGREAARSRSSALPSMCLASRSHLNPAACARSEVVSTGGHFGPGECDGVAGSTALAAREMDILTFRFPVIARVACRGDGRAPCLEERGGEACVRENRKTPELRGRYGPPHWYHFSDARQSVCWGTPVHYFKRIGDTP